MGLSLSLGLNLGSVALDNGEPGVQLFNASGTSTRKVIVSNGASLIWLCSANATGNGYIGQKIEKNNVLPADASNLGGAQEVWRRTYVWQLLEAFICNNTATATSGTGWLAANLNSTTNPYGYGGDSVLRSIPTAYTPTNGDYKDYTVWVDADGKFTLLIQDRTGLSPLGAPSILVTDTDGAVTVADFAADAGTAGMRQVVLTHPTKRSTSFTARITKNSADTRRMVIVGVNSVLITKPSDPMPAGVTYNFDSWVRLAAANPFVNHDGAQDYAFRSLAAGKTGGSVHGGETSTALTTTMDGAAYTFPDRAAGTSFIISQSSLIDFTADGGGQITIDAIRDFSINGRPRQTFTAAGGSSQVYSTAYLGMSTPWTTFIEVVRPVAVADATAGTGTGDTVDDYPQGVTAQIEFRNPSTNQRIVSEANSPFTFPGFEQNVVHYTAAQYVKRWSFGIKANNRALGTARWKTADSYTIAA